MNMIKRINIYDLDGTVIDSSHRYRAINGCIDLKYWRQNEHKCLHDGLLPLASQFIDNINNPEVYVIIATSRVLCSNCYKFIRQNLGVPNHIISRRGNWDKRRAFDIKADGVNKHLFYKGLSLLPKYFYEDNLETCQIVAAKVPNCKGIFVKSKQGH